MTATLTTNEGACPHCGLHDHARECPTLIGHRPSNEKAREVREVLQVVSDCLRPGNAPIRLFELEDVETALREYVRMLEQPPEATGGQPVKRWNTKYPGISMLEHNGDLVRSGFGPYVLAEHYDQLASLLAEAIRMIEGYRRAGWITNPAALEQATDFALRAGNSHHE